MNRMAVWLILISYSLVACGNILEAGCCLDEAAHAVGEHTAHRHAHSKVLVAVHGLSHWSGPEDTQRLVSRHCCCLTQGEQEPGLPPHSLTPRLQKPVASDFPGRAIPSEERDMLVAGPRAGSPHILANLGTAHILQTIHFTILLI
jgi:hypothetical protein